MSVRVHLIALLLVLSGCSSMSGPPSLVGPAGPRPAPMNPNPNDLRKMFVDSFSAAVANRDSAEPDIAKNKAMLKSGFLLIDSSCNEFFQRAGANQRKSRIARDAIAPITALFTGVLALHDFSKNPGAKEDLLQIITLGTAGTIAALDIYDAHFLFGADNIDSVRVQTMNALAVHRGAVLEIASPDFYGALTYLSQNETICTPPSILGRVRAAIKGSNLQPTDETGKKIASSSSGGQPQPPPAGLPAQGQPPAGPAVPGTGNPPAPPLPAPLPSAPSTGSMGVINVDVVRAPNL